LDFPVSVTPGVSAVDVQVHGGHGRQPGPIRLG
jgi:hypothetical protein